MGFSSFGIGMTNLDGENDFQKLSASQWLARPRIKIQPYRLLIECYFKLKIILKSRQILFISTKTAL